MKTDADLLDPARRAGRTVAAGAAANVEPAILLLLAGVALAFVPGMPPIDPGPTGALLMVLRLIYSASIAISWREFKFNLQLVLSCVWVR